MQNLFAGEFWNSIKIISAAEGGKHYFEIISATMNVLENIRELQQACEIILK